MLYFFKLLVFLIESDQATDLNWFEASDLSLDAENNNFEIVENTVNVLNASGESSTDASFGTLKLLLVALFEKIGNGLCIEDIEIISFFILFIRFLILIIKYNLKTSFYITCIGMVAGFLWYRHLYDIATMYRTVYVDILLLNRVSDSMDNTFQLKENSNLPYLQNLDKQKIAWYNVGQLMCYAVLKGVINTDKETVTATYIDPLSMIISSLRKFHNAKVLDIYYTAYNSVLPKVFKICGKFWSQLSGVASYALITRIGKRYCPYLIRWHWTFLLVFAIFEQFIVYFVYRINYFQRYVLGGGEEAFVTEINSSEIQSIIASDPIIRNGPVINNTLVMAIITKIKSFIILLFDFMSWPIPSELRLANILLSVVVLSHLSFIIFGLLYAICGQYFFVPCIVKNTELHVGQKPKNSIYSGGNTPWQEGKPNSKMIFAWEKFLRQLIPTLLRVPRVIFVLIGLLISKRK